MSINTRVLGPWVRLHGIFTRLQISLEHAKKQGGISFEADSIHASYLGMTAEFFSRLLEYVGGAKEAVETGKLAPIPSGYQYDPCRDLLSGLAENGDLSFYSTEKVARYLAMIEQALEEGRITLELIENLLPDVLMINEEAARQTYTPPDIVDIRA